MAHGVWACGVAALVIGDEFPRRRAARARQTSPILALRWSNLAGLESIVISVTRVIHLGHLRASGVLGDAVVTAETGLCGGARRRARVRAVLGTGKGANGAERVRGARVGQNRAMWRRCSNGGGAPVCVVWPQGWTTAYRI
jgi:hypothetical protein